MCLGKEEKTHPFEYFRGRTKLCTFQAKRRSSRKFVVDGASGEFEVFRVCWTWGLCSTQNMGGMVITL